MDAVQAKASSSKKRARVAEKGPAAEPLRSQSDDDHSKLDEADAGDALGGGVEEDDEDERSGSDAGPSSLPSRSRAIDAGTSTAPAKKKKRKVLTPGIVYISRVPPGMTPQKVRHLMARWGEVGKVYAQRKDGELPREQAAGVG